MTKTITLPFPPKECGSNARGHTKHLSRIRKKYKEDCLWVLKQTNLKAPETEIINIHYEFYTPTKAHHDDDNLISRIKYGRDAIADTLGINDNCFRTQVDHIGHDPEKAGYVVVTLEEVE